MQDPLVDFAIFTFVRDQLRINISKMMAFKSLLALATVQAVSAHFGLVFPAWRADTLSEENEERYSQWTYPCKSWPLPCSSNKDRY